MNRRRSKSPLVYVWSILAIVVLVILAIHESKGNTINLNAAMAPVSEKLYAEGFEDIVLIDTYEQLDDWSEQLFDFDMMDATWLLRWEMSLNEQQLKELAQRLYVDQNKKLLNKVVSQQGNHITGLLPYIHGELTMQRVIDEADNSKIIAILKVRNDAQNREHVKGYITHIDDTVSSYTDYRNMSMKITGEMKDDALKRIQTVTRSTKVEEYKDNAMSVVTAHSTELKESYWLTPNKMVNLQYAFYVDKNTENSILTVAIPLISGEFGEITDN